ncbi:hypothetical protein [Streptomyces spectabilis]|uniref:ESX-1 secretion-associated protein n=1 Tax=Streptomyces spectabilis TaxID=68270 RepID=A0A5P2XG49_STRST|nr:hypothetical protein [Streptomyces spectabilis]MBB5108163.1 hypothetical protein [Streptomyces spectabilis]MCI3904385.1 hypothetical protein [Streptomyces spectabilis]QEV61486.1 hypothetical protein CP982_24580 [Streptomyces spectabilis]
MSDRTRADLGMIRDCSDALFRIHREFKNNSNPADEYGDALGSEKLRDVFDDFSGTWKKTRKKLMEDIEKLAKFTDTAADTYDKVDHELAEALRNARKEAKGKK